MTAETITEHELEMIRDYNVTVDRLWKAVTRPEDVVQWFGHDGVDMVRCDMDFTRTGPWSCEMVGKESGTRFWVSGVVTHSRPPKGGSEGSVGFTWAWHDDDGTRGADSHVVFEVSQHEAIARFRLIHRNFSTTEMAQNHNKGWLSCISRLDAYLAS